VEASLKKFRSLKPPEDEQPAPAPESTIAFTIGDDEVKITVDFRVGNNMETLAGVVRMIGTGELLNPILEEIEKCCTEQGRPEVMDQFRNVIIEQIQEAQRIKAIEIGNDLPIVSPIKAIQHILLMYQPTTNQG
jgi:hypothetical protein